MKGSLTLIAGLLQFILASAQPGPSNIPLHVVIELDHALFRDDRPQYLVITPDADTLVADELRTPVHDSILSLQMQHSNAQRPWSVKYLSGGAQMDLYIDHHPSIPTPSIQLKFTQGTYDLSTPRLMKCIADQAADLVGPNAPRPEQNMDHPIATQATLACHGGLLVLARGGGMHMEVRIPDLTPFAKRYPHLPPASVHEASYPGGMANFDRFLRTHFSKPLIERINARVKLSALVTIETDGTIHRVDLNGSAHPELDREFKRVLQLSTWWEPAAVENIRNTIDPRTFRYVEQSMVIEHTVDPDSIWTEIPEESLTIVPAQPTSRDEITVTFHWIGGSCGRYEAHAELQPPSKAGGPRDVFLYFRPLPGELCCDMKPQAHGLTMEPLPPGRYRFRQMPHPELAKGSSTPDPYAVRYVEVR